MVSTGGEPVLPELPGAPKQFLSLFFARRTLHSALGGVVPKNEDLRFSFREHELGRHSTVSVIFEWHRRRKSQGQTARLECCPVSPDQRIVRLSSVIEGWAASDRNAHLSPDAANATIDMAIRRRRGGQPHWHEVFQFGNSVRH